MGRSTDNGPRIARRVRGLCYVAILWVSAGIVLWALPLPQKVGGRMGGAANTKSKLRGTKYGALGWSEVRFGKTMEIRPIRLAATISVSVVATAWMAFACGRIWRNTTPRWQCRYCGYDVAKALSTTSNCPECGRLPNLQKNPWAFWD
jgi:hypothetical protein